MLEIDRLLSKSGLPIQSILICGKNDRLLSELRARIRQMPRLIEGFTSNVPYYIQLADLMIGKPFETIVGAVAEMLEGETFNRFRCNAKKMRNRALFEIPEILSRIVDGSYN